MFQVRLQDDIWDYLKTTVVPSVYNVPPDEPNSTLWYLSDLTNVIIGVPRIRQVRVDHGPQLQCSHCVGSCSSLH